MSARVSAEELHFLRNHIPIREVLHVLQVPWMKQDLLCRFRCPLCQGMDTSLHPRENLGRCFACRKNFNPIDLVCSVRNVRFHEAVQWLRALHGCRAEPAFSSRLCDIQKKSQIT